LIAFYQTANTIHEDVHNKIKVSAFDVFTGESVEKFVTYMSLVYVFTFMSFYTSFDLTCDELYGYSNKAMDVALLRSNPELVEKAKLYISWFFTTSIETILQVPQLNQVIDTQKTATIIDGNNTKQNIPVAQYPANDPWAKYRVASTTWTTSQPTTNPQWWSIVDTIKMHQSAPITWVSSAAVLTAIEEYRKRLLEQTVDSSDQIEQWVCSVVIKEIKSKYSDPDFKISVIFMMYLIIRPAMELGLHLISYVNWAIFQLMFKLWRFRKYEDWEVGENLE